MTATTIQYFDGEVVGSMPVISINVRVPPRHCIRETFSEGPAPGCVDGHWLKVWTFHYSDGTTEQLKQVIKL